jgi:fermentation-respiration switch protein FrsA (DUF1100 family)
LYRDGEQMMMKRERQFWILLFVAMTLLAGCGGRATPTPEAVAAASARDGGGISANEPTLAPAAPTAALPAATPAPTVALPAPSPTAAATATRLPEPTATLPVPTPTAPAATPTPTATFPSRDPHPLQIAVMRQQSYPGSPITVEQTLPPGANYSRYLVSYRSEGNKIYALMTVPNGPKPATGWPAIIFNHGYIAPAVYRTLERYVAYVDTIARNGYIVFKSDYRGHGSSEGRAEGGYGTPGYTADVLNALAAVKAFKDTDPNRIGMWGHSMGGSLVLRAMVVVPEIKAGVIWGGVVAPYPNIFARVTDPTRPTVTPRATATPIPAGGLGPYGRPWRQELTEKYGTPEQNPAFWASISPNSFLAEIAGPLQLHHSVTDETVPVASSQTLYAEMQAAGKPAELFTYPGDNHDIAANFGVAMQRTVTFFDKYVKGAVR